MIHDGSSSNKPLAGQAAIVTGGGSGIGRETCFALAKAGVHVVVADRNLKNAQATLDEMNRADGSGDHICLAVDVTSELTLSQMVDAVLKKYSSIDILIHSAGVLRAPGSGPRLMNQITVDEFDFVVDTNLKGTFLTNRSVLPAMIGKKRGQIVNVASTSGRIGRPFDSVYCASKFGVVGLTQSLAEEVRPFGIKVQSVLPDAVDTPLWDQNGPVRAPDWSLPAERVAEVILYMVSLPTDTVLGEIAIHPFRTRRRKRQPVERNESQAERS